MEFDFYKLFSFQANTPLDFLQPFFWGFFFFVLALYAVLHKKIAARNVMLLMASFFFYYKSGGFYFWLLIFSTITDFFLALWIHQAHKTFFKRLLLLLSLLCNLGVLLYYKYAYLLTNFINTIFHTNFVAKDYLAQLSNLLAGTNFDITQIILPVGISFYVFQTLSYTIDVYRGKLQPTKNILDFALFVSFFPQLVAGPIVRASDFLPQIQNKYNISSEEMSKAFWLIIKGLTKKVFADYLSINLVSRIFENPLMYSGFENLMGVYGFAIQIYFDFSGYTDIAIGLALLLGFRLPLNFNQPYKAANITEFWRRWHISLSSWLRDYLYISLGGNREVSLFTYASFPTILFILLLLSKQVWLSWFFLIVFLLFWIFWLKSFKNIWAFGGLHILVLWAGLLYTQKNFLVLGFVFLVFLVWLVLLLFPSQRKVVGTYANLMLTMLLGGLWHGAALRFIIWGALHGLALGLHKIWQKLTAQHDFFLKNKFWIFLSQILTFHFASFCWIFFRASPIQLGENYQMSDIEVAIRILNKIASDFYPEQITSILISYKSVFLLLFVAYFLHFLPEKLKKIWLVFFTRQSDLLKALLIFIWLVFFFYQLRNISIQPFIYFQF